LTEVKPAELINHHSNDDRLKKNTTSNTVAELRRWGLLCNDRHQGEVLTLFGRKELERMNAVIGLA
jgi:hypothetical protein